MIVSTSENLARMHGVRSDGYRLTPAVQGPLHGGKNLTIAASWEQRRTQRGRTGHAAVSPRSPSSYYLVAAPDQRLDFCRT